MNHELSYQKFLRNNPYPRTLTSERYSDGFAGQERGAGAGSSLNPTKIDFSSNDYLGLSRHPELVQRSQKFAAEYGVGGRSSRLVGGNSPLYAEIEKRLAERIGKESALILGTGFQANVTLLQSLLDSAVLGQKALVFCDRHCHVSMLSPIQNSRWHRFQHNDLDHLETLLIKYCNDKAPKWILVESLYGMDGDQADLPAVVALARKYSAQLYVDDAHSVGVYGREGFGMASDHAEGIDFIFGTFSKGFGSFGGYIGCSKVMREYFINRCTGLIYSTALPPTVLGTISAAMELVPKMNEERRKLLSQAAELRTYLKEKGQDCGLGSSQIVPWIVGSAKAAVEVDRQLSDQGIIGTAIRPPSVPRDRSRIRFCLRANHSVEDLNRLKSAIGRILP